MSQPEFVLGVDGMACEGCARSVVRAITQLDPAAQVSVDLAAKRVTIRTAGRELPEYKAAVTAAGYNILPQAGA